MEKLNVLIFVGTDGTGKSTIKKAIEKFSEYGYIVIDRLTDSIVYDEIYDRPDRKQLFYDFENNLAKIANVMLVYFTCSPKIQMLRLNDKGEPNNIVAAIDSAKRLYIEYLVNTNLYYTIIDTSKNNVDRSVKQIDTMFRTYFGGENGTNNGQSW